jgi:hypothetical protein
MGSDAESEHWLRKNLTDSFALPADAVEWLIALWNAIQVFDDMADGEFPDRDRLNAAILDTLVNMPANSFFLRHAHTLLPLVAVQVLKWNAADTAERAGEADVRSFAWRAGYYDVVLAVVQIAHGDDVALQVAQAAMQLYGEDYAAYLAEFHPEANDA